MPGVSGGPDGPGRLGEGTGDGSEGKASMFGVGEYAYDGAPPAAGSAAEVLEDHGYRPTPGGGFIRDVQAWDVLPSGRDWLRQVWQVGAIDHGERAGAGRFEVVARPVDPWDGHQGHYRALYATTRAEWVELACEVLHAPWAVAWGKRR